MSYHDLLELMNTRNAPDYLYRQLAEECAELAQAALKVIRAQNAETPQKEEDAIAHYIEELADVSIMAELAYAQLDDAQKAKLREIEEYKCSRMAERLTAQCTERRRTAQKGAESAEGKESEGFDKDEWIRIITDLFRLSLCDAQKAIKLAWGEYDD